MLVKCGVSSMLVHLNSRLKLGLTLADSVLSPTWL